MELLTGLVASIVHELYITDHSTVYSKGPHWLEHHQDQAGDHDGGGDVEGRGGAVDDVDHPVLLDVKGVADGPAMVVLYSMQGSPCYIPYLKSGNFAPLHIPMKSSVSMDQVITPASPWSKA